MKQVLDRTPLLFPTLEPNYAVIGEPRARAPCCIAKLERS